mmetsp:Transcript_9768/g.10834  ORF Transcript_9768/g.10834 Transcript_9768/m.10834 type:complete len:86 (-) Transcript_9768:1653-1910(-)
MDCGWMDGSTATTTMSTTVSYVLYAICSSSDTHHYYSFSSLGWVGLGWNGLLVIVSVLIDGVAAVDVDVAAAIDVDVCGTSFIVT